MQQKNVFITYSPGYHGSYISWAIAVSDKDSYETTVKNPINTTESSQWGGLGTSHLHVRIPTHQSILDHLAWRSYNKKFDDHRCYICNAIQFNSQKTQEEFLEIFQHDPNSIIIAIYDDNEIVRSYGRINCVTKWPTYMAATTISHLTFNWLTEDEYNRIKSIDFYNCADNIFLRNIFVKYNKWLGGNSKVNKESFQAMLNAKVDWFKIRNSKQPHEVNLDTYADLSKVNLDTQLFNVNIMDIVSNNFPTILRDILTKSGISTNFNLSAVEQVHQQYINAQSNLQWFSSYAKWEKTGELDDFIDSHIVIQAQIISFILQKSNVKFISKNEVIEWLGGYNLLKGVDWPIPPASPLLFHELPEFVKEEMKVSGYNPIVQELPNRAILDLVTSSEWEHFSLREINNIYQRSIR